MSPLDPGTGPMTHTPLLAAVLGAVTVGFLGARVTETFLSAPSLGKPTLTATRVAPATGTPTPPPTSRPTAVGTPAAAHGASLQSGRPGSQLQQPSGLRLPMVFASAAIVGVVTFVWRLMRNVGTWPLAPLGTDSFASTTMLTYSGSSDVTTKSLCDDLLRAAERSDRGQARSTVDNTQVKDLILRLERAMLGQKTATAQINGEWELVWASEDVTRSSPFFWAFRQAFPDQADQIFSITDNVPGQLKGIGPAFQTITMCEGPGEGTLVSRVQIKALPDAPVPLVSMMITTSAIVSRTATKLTLRVQDTRVREATLPLWDQTPPFPSGQALDLVRKGSSEVVMTTVYLDDRVRISRNDADGATFVWKRP